MYSFLRFPNFRKKALIFSVDMRRVKNPTATDLWICVQGKELFLPAGEEQNIEF